MANLSLLLFLRIFRSFVLWFLKELSRNVFHCSVIKDHFYLAVSQTALIFYHVAFDLSRTFFTFFKSLWKLFVPDPSYFVFLRRNSEIISSVFRFVKNFFQVFWFFQLFRFSGISWIPAVHRQLSMTALLGYHGVSSLSTLIFHYIDEKLIDKNWLTKRFTLGNLSLISSNLTFSCFSRPNARITSIPPAVPQH